tara:strand:- start:2 stop:310 length:309 start_codon:yes stop_codon:yes gene_type:complete
MEYAMAKRSIDYDIVEVVWKDAEELGDVGWNDLKKQLKEAKQPCPTMRTVGYVVYRGEDHIAILSTIGDKDCSTLEKIPMSFVLDIIEYSPNNPPKEPQSGS